MLSFQVDATNPAAPTVAVGGQEQKGLARVVVDMVPGGIPQLVLTYLAGGTFQGDAEVYVVEAGPLAVAAFLDRVSPADLERAALEAGEKAPMSPGAAFLAGLRSILGVPEAGGAGT